MYTARTHKTRKETALHRSKYLSASVSVSLNGGTLPSTEERANLFFILLIPACGERAVVELSINPFAGRAWPMA